MGLGVLSLLILLSLTNCSLYEYMQTVTPKGWDLDESNTGLSGVRISPSSLSPYTGSSAPSAGTVIRKKIIVTTLDLSAGNIVIDRCWIRPASVTKGTHIIVNNNLTSTVTITNCDIDCSAVDAELVAYSCAFVGSGVIENCNIFGMGSGIWLRGQGSVDSLSEGNYIHGLRAWGNAATTGSHNDGLTVRDFSGHQLIVRGNRINCSSGNDTGAIFIQPSSGHIDNVFIEDNLLEGLGWNLGLEAALTRFPENGGYGTSMRAVNNRFSPTGFGTNYVSEGPGWSASTDNYLNDPHKFDNRGIAVSTE